MTAAAELDPGGSYDSVIEKAFEACWASRDAREAIRARSEGRTPDFMPDMTGSGGA